MSIAAIRRVFCGDTDEITPYSIGVRPLYCFFPYANGSSLPDAYKKCLAVLEMPDAQIDAVPYVGLVYRFPEATIAIPKTIQLSFRLRQITEIPLKI